MLNPSLDGFIPATVTTSGTFRKYMQVFKCMLPILFH